MEDLTFEIDDETLDRLRTLAGSQGCTTEELAERLIKTAVLEERPSSSGQSAAAAFAGLREEAGGGVDLDLPDRSEWKDRPLDRSA